MSKEAMKLALEALKNAHSCTAQEYDNAIKALEEALAKQEQGELATKEQIREAVVFNLPLYTTTPQQRTWVGLSDEEVIDLWHKTEPYYHEDDFARAIEAKLKEKNT